MSDDIRISFKDALSLKKAAEDEIFNIIKALSERLETRVNSLELDGGHKTGGFSRIKITLDV